MRQRPDLLLHEILGWPDVSSRPMFGMTAVYRGNGIFGVLPRTRAMDTPYSVSFKILWRNPSLKKRLEADARTLPSTRDAKWNLGISELMIPRIEQLLPVAPWHLLARLPDVGLRPGFPKDFVIRVWADPRASLRIPHDLSKR